MCVVGGDGGSHLSAFTGDAPSLGPSEDLLTPPLSQGLRAPAGTLQDFSVSTIPVNPEHSCVWLPLSPSFPPLLCLPTICFSLTQDPPVCPMSSELTQTHPLFSLTSSDSIISSVLTPPKFILAASALSQPQTRGISTWKYY